MSWLPLLHSKAISCWTFTISVSLVDSESKQSTTYRPVLTRSYHRHVSSPIELSGLLVEVTTAAMTHPSCRGRRCWKRAPMSHASVLLFCLFFRVRSMCSCERRSRSQFSEQYTWRIRHGPYRAPVKLTPSERPKPRTGRACPGYHSFRTGAFRHGAFSLFQQESSASGFGSIFQSQPPLQPPLPIPLTCRGTLLSRYIQSAGLTGCKNEPNTCSRSQLWPARAGIHDGQGMGIYSFNLKLPKLTRGPDSSSFSPRQTWKPSRLWIL